MSSFHCEVTVEPTHVAVRDLQSTNGTFINDQPITEAVLADGEILQLGSVTFRLQSEELEIRVPKVTSPDAEAKKAEDASRQPLPDGSLPCRKNPHLPATHRCEKCQAPYNIGSLRGVRLSGGKSYLLFCPECDGKCLPIDGITSNRHKKSLLGRLTQTISLGFGRKQ